MGTVEFPPREGEAGGKAVRNISVAQTGFKEQAVRISATLWPSHAHVAVAEGDVVVLRGSYTQNKKTKDDGTPVTYHNLSVVAIKNLGSMDSGVKPETENVPAAEDTPDDDIPF